jgi:hypothetical protein
MPDMKRLGRFVLIGVVAVIVVLGLGYVWGSSGRTQLQGALDDVRQQLDLAEARGELLDARVNLYNNNFGDASRHFEEAKEPLRRTRQRYQEAGRDAAARSIGAALETVDEAQRLSGKLDPTANAKAGEALEAIRVATAQ